MVDTNNTQNEITEELSTPNESSERLQALMIQAAMSDNTYKPTENQMDKVLALREKLWIILSKKELFCILKIYFVPVY